MEIAGAPGPSQADRKSPSGNDRIRASPAGRSGSAQGFNGQTGTRYLGFKVHDSNTFSDYYGWIEYVYSSTSPNTVTVSRWAYESNPFGPATAGATGTVADAPAGGAVPGLGGLAALAMGAAGVRRSRNRVA